jgi:lipoprotein-releasing system ATP-binding protein
MILKLNHIHQVYQQGEESLHVLKGIDITLKAGEIVALVGSSGSGKSTLLHIAGLLETPSKGEVIIDDQSVKTLNERARTRLRGQSIGFIYQFHHLLPEFTALENVMMPLLINKTPKAQILATDMLNRMGLGHRLSHRPNKLSGGEQQRVAIARALIHHPKILLADEPTGNLDDETSDYVFKELINLIREENVCALIATHDLDLASKMDRALRLHNGVLEEVSKKNESA